MDIVLIITTMVAEFFLSFFLFNCGKKRVSVLVTVALYVLCFASKILLFMKKLKVTSFKKIIRRPTRHVVRVQV